MAFEVDPFMTNLHESIKDGTEEVDNISLAEIQGAAETSRPLTNYVIAWDPVREWSAQALTAKVVEALRLHDMESIAEEFLRKSEGLIRVRAVFTIATEFVKISVSETKFGRIPALKKENKKREAQQEEAVEERLDNHCKETQEIINSLQPGDEFNYEYRQWRVVARGEEHVQLVIANGLGDKLKINHKYRLGQLNNSTFKLTKKAEQKGLFDKLKGRFKI